MSEPFAWLLPEHRPWLTSRGITEQVARDRGIESLTTANAIAKRGFGRNQQNPPGLLIPLRSVTGAVAGYQLRPSQLRVKDGRVLKYEMPHRSRLVVDIPPVCLTRVRDWQTTLYVTESPLKGDAGASHGLCIISIAGAHGWRGQHDNGSIAALPDWESIPLKGRDERGNEIRRLVRLAMDSDVATNPHVHDAARRFAAFLEQRGAEVQFVILSPTAAGDKVGLDDALAGGMTPANFVIVDELPPRPGGSSTASGKYTVSDGAFALRKRTGDTEYLDPLCNFTASIVEQTTYDDGATTRGELTIHGALADGTPLSPARVPVAQFAPMNWPTTSWGTGAIVFAGMGTKDHLRVAILTASAGQTVKREVFTHTGWRQLAGHGWCYLHAGGAIGPNGPISDVEIQLSGGVSRTHLPDPPAGDALIAAIRASIDLRDLAPPRIMAPALAAVYRAVLAEVAPVDCGIWITGQTGTFKSELAALLQQHYGAGFDRLHLPAAWSATSNALERTCFDFKDALGVIDDFAPSGSAVDVARLHATAERVLRGVGNRASRGRMTADGALRPDYPPRGLVVGTGEDVPRGQSVRARTVIVEIARGDIDRDKLTTAQATAASGSYALALAGYVRWLAPQLERMREQLPVLIARYREWAYRSEAHARTAEAIAHLAAGWGVWLRFAVDSGAVTTPEAEAVFVELWAALGETACQQASHQVSEEPTRVFLDLLASAIASGSAHVAGLTGGAPASPEAWGWKAQLLGGAGSERLDWVRQGVGVGWVEGDDLYLDVNAALAAAQRMGQPAGRTVPVGGKTLTKRLHERGLLRSTDRADRLQIRKQLAGARRAVLHLSATELVSPPGQSDQSDHDGAEAAPEQGNRFEPSPISWSDFRDPAKESDHESANWRGDGPIGPIGPIPERGVAHRNGADTRTGADIAGTDDPDDAWRHAERVFEPSIAEERISGCDSPELCRQTGSCCFPGLCRADRHRMTPQAA